IAQEGAAGSALVCDVCPLSVWMKAELPGVGLVLEPEIWRILRRESPLRRIDAVDEDFVQDGIGGDEEAIFRRDVDGVAMRFDLGASLRHTGALAGILVAGGGFA